MSKPLSSLLPLTLLLSLPLGASPPAARAAPIYTVAIGQFDDTSGFRWRWDVGSTWITFLGAALRGEEALELVDVARPALDDQPRPTSAQLLLIGKVTHADTERSSAGGGVAVRGLSLGLGGRDHGRVDVELSVLDGASGRVLASTVVTGEQRKRTVSVGFAEIRRSAELNAIRKDAVGRAMEEAAAEAARWLVGRLDEFPWKAAVVALEGDTVLVNRGDREGVSRGTVFLAGREEVLRDPTTGEALRATFAETARLEVVSVDERLATCRLIAGLVSELSPGVEVRLR